MLERPCRRWRYELSKVKRLNQFQCNYVWQMASRCANKPTHSQWLTTKSTIDKTLFSSSKQFRFLDVARKILMFMSINHFHSIRESWSRSIKFICSVMVYGFFLRWKAFESWIWDPTISTKSSLYAILSRTKYVRVGIYSFISYLVDYFLPEDHL